VSYEVRVPVTRRTDRLSNAILRLDGEKVTAVDWEEKKVKS
jgi:hypothetical protein